TSGQELSLRPQLLHGGSPDASVRGIRLHAETGGCRGLLIVGAACVDCTLAHSPAQRFSRPEPGGVAEPRASALEPSRQRLASPTAAPPPSCERRAATVRVSPSPALRPASR